jgi:hypothetical protein
LNVRVLASNKCHRSFSGLIGLFWHELGKHGIGLGVFPSEIGVQFRSVENTLKLNGCDFTTGLNHSNAGFGEPGDVPKRKMDAEWMNATQPWKLVDDGLENQLGPVIAEVLDRFLSQAPFVSVDRYASNPSRDYAPVHNLRNQYAPEHSTTLGDLIVPTQHPPYAGVAWL